jgi:hypothetical protein
VLLNEDCYKRFINRQTLKGLGGCRTPFGVPWLFEVLIPRVVATLQPWAEISERLRRTISGFICLSQIDW